MARKTGSFPISTNFEVKIKGEFDARKYVSSYADLLSFTEDEYIPYGFIVTCMATDDLTKRGLYMCINENQLALATSWYKLTNDIPYNSLLFTGGLEVSGLTVTVKAPTAWDVNGIQYGKETNTSFNLSALPINKSQIAIIYGKTDNTMGIIYGLQSDTIAVEPNLPANSARIAPIYLRGNSIISAEPALPGQNGNFIKANPSSPQVASINIQGNLTALGGNTTLNLTTIINDDGGHGLNFLGYNSSSNYEFWNSDGYTNEGLVITHGNHNNHTGGIRIVDSNIYDYQDGRKFAKEGDYIQANPTSPQSAFINLSSYIQTGVLRISNNSGTGISTYENIGSFGGDGYHVFKVNGIPSFSIRQNDIYDQNGNTAVFNTKEASLSKLTLSSAVIFNNTFNTDKMSLQAGGSTLAIFNNAGEDVISFEQSKAIVLRHALGAPTQPNPTVLLRSANYLREIPLSDLGSSYAFSDGLNEANGQVRLGGDYAYNSTIVIGQDYEEGYKKPTLKLSDSIDGEQYQEIDLRGGGKFGNNEQISYGLQMVRDYDSTGVGVKLGTGVFNSSTGSLLKIHSVKGTTFEVVDVDQTSLHRHGIRYVGINNQNLLPDSLVPKSYVDSVAGGGTPPDLTNYARKDQVNIFTANQTIQKDLPLIEFKSTVFNESFNMGYQSDYTGNFQIRNHQGKKLLTLSNPIATGMHAQFGIGNIPTGNIPAESQLYVYGGASGANIDTRGRFDYDEGNIDLEGADWAGGPNGEQTVSNSLGFSYFGNYNNHAQPVLGYQAKKLGQIRYNNADYALITSLNIDINGVHKIVPIRFGIDGVEIANVNDKGLAYQSDFSALNFSNPRWLVDKAYVDNITGLYVPISNVGRGGDQVLRRDGEGNVISGRISVAGVNGGATDNVNTSTSFQLNDAFDAPDVSRSGRMQLMSDGDLGFLTWRGSGGVGLWSERMRFSNVDGSMMYLTVNDGSFDEYVLTIGSDRKVKEVAKASLGSGGGGINGSSGEYVPTLTNSQNINDSGHIHSTYMRIGNIVNVYGYISYAGNSSTSQRLINVSLPFPSDLSATNTLMGVATSNGLTNSGVSYDANLDVAVIYFNSQPNMGGFVQYTFSYKIIGLP